MNILKQLTPAKGLWLSLVLFAALALVACGGGSSGGSSSSSGNGSGSNGENGDSDTPGFADDPEMVEGPREPLGDQTRALLDLQTSGDAASDTDHSLPSGVRSRVYLRYLESFEHPVPDLFFDPDQRAMRR